jgi:hypothetical protein
MKTILNNKRTLILGLIILGAIVVTVGYSHNFSAKKYIPPPPQYIVDENMNIIGTWVSEVDANYRLVFNDSGICYSYYGSDILATYSFSISNTTPQCGVSVLVNESEETSYLQLSDVNNGTVVCYEINGITDLLSLTTVESGRLLTFAKF